MKNYLFRIIIIVSSLLGCTACFDLQENLFLKKDGSGNFSFAVNMGEFKSMIEMFDDGNNIKVNDKSQTKRSPTEKLNASFEITRRKLLNTKGISNVKTIEDTINYTFGLGFDFKDIDALNKAMNILFDDDSIKTNTKETVYFTWKDNQLTRLESLDTKSFLGKTTTLTNNNRNTKQENDFFNLDKLFESVSYSTYYEFENKVISSNNESALLSSNSKKVILKCYPFATIKDSTQKKCVIANTITFK